MLLLKDGSTRMVESLMAPIDGLRVIIEPFIVGSADTSRPLLGARSVNPLHHIRKKKKKEEEQEEVYS